MPQGADSFIQAIARKAGDAVLERFGIDGLQYSKSKFRSDALTKADLMSNEIIVNAIKEKYPGHGIISEESEAYNVDADYVWVIDPIDGTLNFSLGVPMFGTMLALVHKKSVILSAIYLPAAKELFYAKRGEGAYLNDKKIACSDLTSMAHTIGAGSTTLRLRVIPFFKKLLEIATGEEGLAYSSLGSMAVNGCYVACGRRDWMVALVGGVHDFAPISLILEEAGCVITDSNGAPWTFGMLEIVAANPTIHAELLALTKDI